MINYKILHIPTGCFIYDQFLIQRPRKASEILINWLDCFADVYDTRREEVENNYQISIGSPELYEEYRLNHKIPLLDEFEIVVMQS